MKQAIVILFCLSLFGCGGFFDLDTENQKQSQKQKTQKPAPKESIIPDNEPEKPNPDIKWI